MKNYKVALLTLTLSLLIVTPSSQANQPQQQISFLHKLDTLLNTTATWLTNYTNPYDDENLDFSTPLVAAGIICFLAASISSAGGIGGGGLFIPILTLVAGLDLRTASGFSAFMVTGGSVANVMYNMYLKGGKSLIDYDVALLSEPCLLLGVSLGVVCNHVFPEWLTTSIFALFLAWTTSMSLRNGLARWRQESREIEMRRNVESREEGCENVGGTVPLLGEETQEDSRVGIPWMKMVVLVLIWCSFCLVYLLRGNRYAKGIADIKPCGVGYWVLTSLPIPLAIVYTTWILCKDENLQQHTLNEKDNEEMSKLEPVNKLAFPAMALLAGILGGLFGLGGGMLISPLLLHVGIPPEVTAATCCFMVFFSSSMSSFQYLLLGMEHVDAALVFAFACFVASLLGLLVLQRAIKNYGRASLIVFSVSLVMALSTVLMTTFGMLRVWSDFKSGRYMGFREPC